MTHRINRAALTLLPIRSPRIRSFRHPDTAQRPSICLSTHSTGVPVRMIPFRLVWRRSSLRFLKFLVNKKLALRTPNPVHLALHQRAGWAPQQFLEVNPVLP